MLRIADNRLDQLIAEDVPYIDLTSEVLGLSGKMGRMSYFTREAGTLCGTEEAARMCQKLGLIVVESKPSGTQLEPQDVFLVVEGSCECLHMAWKVCLNLYAVQLEKTEPSRVADLVKELRAINPQVTIVAAGGINMDNCADYAATGIDGIATMCLFTAKPLDMSVRMEAL